MEKIYAGILLWSVAHFVPTLGLGLKVTIVERIGEYPYKGLITLVLYLSIGLIYWGWTTTDPIGVYEPFFWSVHVNNTLMLAALYLVISGSVKTWVCQWVRHPMLMGLVVWGFAHLLANGDQRSIALFSGLTVWAVVDMILINARDGAWVKPDSSSLTKEIIAIVATLVGIGLIGYVHSWLGLFPFPQS